MNTAKRVFFLLLALILVFSLAACGAAKSESAVTNDTASSGSAPQAIPEAEKGAADMGSNSYAGFGQGSDEAQQGENVVSLPESDKIVYTGYAQLETLEFDKTLEGLKQLISSCGGFVQTSSITGGDYASMYDGSASYRTADYTIRVPVAQFNTVTDSLKTLGNVVSSSMNADNITMQYMDTASRLEAYQTQETRLLELLSKASSVEDMLAIENSLSNVRYQIESLTSQIKNWDSQISYSTLTVSIREVALYSKDNSSSVSYGVQLKEAFTHSLYALGHFFKNLLKFLVAAFPTLVVLGLIALVVILIVRAANRKKAKKRAALDAQHPDETSPNDRQSQ